MPSLNLSPAVTIGVLEHPQRPPRCYQSIDHQTLSNKLTVKKSLLPNTSEECSRHQIAFINTLLDTKTPYICWWSDDVAIADPEYLTKCAATIADKPATAGLPCPELSGHRRSWPARVWIAKRKYLRPIVFSQLTDTKFSDAQITWLIDQGLQGYTLETDWNHWIPVNLNNIHPPGYVLEEHDSDGNVSTDLTIKLHVDPKQKFSIHPKLMQKHKYATQL